MKFIMTLLVLMSLLITEAVYGNFGPPTNITATPGDGQVTLSWTHPSDINKEDITSYSIRINYHHLWEPIYVAQHPTILSNPSWNQKYFPTSTAPNRKPLKNGRKYLFHIKAIDDKPGGRGHGSWSVGVTPTPNIPSPTGLTATPGDGQITLKWAAPSIIAPITAYQYRVDGGAWTSTGGTSTTYTVPGLTNGISYTFEIRAVRDTDGDIEYGLTSRTGTITLQQPAEEKPKRRIRYECPVGWVRSDGFAGRNRRVLIYEVKLDMNLQNHTSIYQPDWVAIYVHPDEALENLEGWKLQVAVPYNHHREYLLTAENSVVVDAGFVEGGFAFIANPEENPFPMTGVGFTGSPAPGFDYRLYDDTGRRVDFGISCYKRFDIFQVLKDLEDPRVLRNVSLKDVDWNASWFIRSEWTLPIPVNAPGAPSLQGVNLVGKWADLKKK